jgi:hypothetical protein
MQALATCSQDLRWIPRVYLNGTNCKVFFPRPASKICISISPCRMQECSTGSVASIANVRTFALLEAPCSSPPEISFQQLVGAMAPNPNIVEALRRLSARFAIRLNSQTMHCLVSGTHHLGGVYMAKGNKNKRLFIRVSEGEKNRILELMKQAEINNISEYARQMLLNGQVVKKDFSELKGLIAQIGRIGGNVNQIAKRANESRIVAQEDIDETMFCLRRVLRILESDVRKVLREI